MDNVGTLLTFLKKESQHKISESNKPNKIEIKDNIIKPIETEQEVKKDQYSEITQMDKILNAASMLKGTGAKKTPNKKIVELW